MLDRCRTITYKPLRSHEGLFVPARYAQVAQLVEQRIENPRVGGSIPPLAPLPLPIGEYTNSKMTYFQYVETHSIFICAPNGWML